jgi:denticleless
VSITWPARFPILTMRRAIKIWDPRFNTRATPQPLATLPDPTAISKRARGIHSMVEQPSTGDLHILTGTGRVHVVRPSAMGDLREAIQPVEYYHDQLRSSFWMRLAFSPCGRYLAGGSASGGVMTWDTSLRGTRSSAGILKEIRATRLGLGPSAYTAREREVSAVDWGHDMVSRPFPCDV